MFFKGPPLPSKGSGKLAKRRLANNTFRKMLFPQRGLPEEAFRIDVANNTEMPV